MRIGRILAPVHSLGPGNRIVLWTQGCSKHCPGCIAPELQEKIGNSIPEEQLSRIMTQLSEKEACHGLTISGGDPFEQADALYELLIRVRDIFSDILVYTGYTFQEIQAGAAGEAGIKCLSSMDVLIDGRYEAALNTPDCVLRGSSNQCIYFLNESLRETYEYYMKKGRIMETFSHGSEIIVTGIMNGEEGL